MTQQSEALRVNQEATGGADSAGIGGGDSGNGGEVIFSTPIEIPKLKKDEYNIDIKTSVENDDNGYGGNVTGGEEFSARI